VVGSLFLEDQYEEIIFVGGSSAGAITSCHVVYDDRDWSHRENLKGIISL
jgi:hypothetical protein